MSWLQLTLRGVAPELAEAALESVGALAVSMADAADELLVEPAPGAGPLWQDTTVTGLFTAEANAVELRNALLRMLADSNRDPPRIHSELVEDRDWIRAWMDHYQPMHFGGRLWVCPRGHPAPADDAVVVYLEPGLAFGTGTHPTTALCLARLACDPPAGKRVIDYGCGSGILAIAAARLGAQWVGYYDTDPQAMLATRDNAADNGVESQLEAFDQPAPPCKPADLLLANILAAPLVELAGLLSARVKIGGRLVLSGLLARQENEVMAAYAEQFEFDQTTDQDGWSCLSGRRVS